MLIKLYNEYRTGAWIIIKLFTEGTKALVQMQVSASKCEGRNLECQQVNLSARTLRRISYIFNTCVYGLDVVSCVVGFCISCKTQS